MLLIFVLTLIFQLTNGARILCVMPQPFLSHQMTFQPIWRELSLRGHKVTTIVTDGINDKSLTNLTEIVIEDLYGSLKRNNFLEIDVQDDFFGFIKVLEDFVWDLYEVQFYDGRVKKIMDDPKSKFDLVIFEAATYPLAYSWKLNCPSIGVISMQAPMPYNYALGNPGHPLINPDFLLEIDDVDNMTFMEKLASLFHYVSCHLICYKIFSWYDDIHLKHFGEGVPKLGDMIKNIDMLFMVNNPILQEVVAVFPHTISLGSGLHIQQKKDLPKDIQQYLDDSIEPVVYFSLGTTVKSNLLTQKDKQAIYEAFSELPYKFLVKSDWVNLTIPKNAKTSKWLPQQDILRHKNVRLFITQGGLQSLEEGVANGVPMIGIPFLADQYQNVQKIVKRGIALKISKNKITKDVVKEAIIEVLTTSKYKEKISEMQKLMFDEPMPSLEKAIWWIEYVLRHKGAPLFKSKAQKIPIHEFLMFDIIAVGLIVLWISFYLFYKIITLVSKLICLFMSIFREKRLKDKHV